MNLTLRTLPYPLKTASTDRSCFYTRSESTEYVYQAHPSAAGGTVGATTSANFSCKNYDGGLVTSHQEGSHAGIFGGEVDHKGNLLQGSTHNVLKEGKTLREELKGSADPSIFVEKVGLQKPYLLRSVQFDAKKSSGTLSNTLDRALDDFERVGSRFEKDPLQRVTQREITAGKGS